MPFDGKKQPGELAYTIIGKVLDYFGDGSTWIQDSFSSPQGMCLQGALTLIRLHSNTYGDRADYYIRRAIIEGLRGLHGNDLENRLLSLFATPELCTTKNVSPMLLNDIADDYETVRSVLLAARNLAHDNILHPLPPVPRRRCKSEAPANPERLYHHLPIQVRSRVAKRRDDLLKILATST